MVVGVHSCTPSFPGVRIMISCAGLRFVLGLGLGSWSRGQGYDIICTVLGILLRFYFGFAGEVLRLGKSAFLT